MRRWLPTVAVLAALALGACSSATYQQETGASASSSTTVDRDGPTSSGGGGGGGGSGPAGGEVLSVDDLVCEAGEPGEDAIEVPCTGPHDAETFELDSSELVDCLAAIVASSDVVVVESDFYDSGWEIDDERISGHSFSGGMRSVTCTIYLADTRSGALLGA